MWAENIAVQIRAYGTRLEKFNYSQRGRNDYLVKREVITIGVKTRRVLKKRKVYRTR